jgi:mRNA interferase MazF
MARISQPRPRQAQVVKRGEVWLAAIDPTIGSEIQKTRPCLVISPDELNDHLRTVVVAPMTTGSRPAPWRIPAKFQNKNRFLLLDEISTLDRERLIRALGTISANTLNQTLAVLRELFADRALAGNKHRRPANDGTIAA